MIMRGANRPSRLTTTKVRRKSLFRIVMQIPLQLTFEGCEPSETVRAAIEHEVDRLEEHNRRIIGCRVAVIAPSHKHRHGGGFEIRIWLTIPPHENLIVNHAPSDDARHEHVEVAVKRCVCLCPAATR